MNLLPRMNVMLDFSQLSINNPDFETWKATPLLPTWIYSCRSRVTVSCALPFTTKVTISTSISHTFRSWVEIFHSRQPMVFLSHSSYGRPGLLLLWMFYSKGGATFIWAPRTGIQCMSWNVWNRPSESFMVDMGNSSNIMKSPSHVTWHSGTWPYTMTH